MKLKGIIDYDCVNYKDACMTLMFPYCSFKCDRENGCNVCQNSSLVEEKTLDNEHKKKLKENNNTEELKND